MNSAPRLVLARLDPALKLAELRALPTDAVELDWLDWLSVPDRLKASRARALKDNLGERILTFPLRWLHPLQSAQDELHERAELLAYWAKTLEISRVHATGTSLAVDWHGLLPGDLRARAYREAARGAAVQPGEIPDPFHHFGALKETSLPDKPPRGTPRDTYWKVHGWHPERWIRRYNSEALSTLARWMRETQATHVCLAHSQRREQLSELRGCFRALKPSADSAR